jgi:hypothetical protein
MSSEATNDRKRKEPTAEPEAFVVSSQDQNHNTQDSKARRVCTDSSVFTVASTHTTALVKNEAVPATNAAFVSDDEHEESMQRSIGALIQDLFHSSNVKVNAALDALLSLELHKHTYKSDTAVLCGGCAALVQLVKRCLKMVTRMKMVTKMKTIPAREQVAKLNELALAELTTLGKSLCVIVNLTYMHDVSKVGITAVGGVEAVVEVMKTLPKCQPLQRVACIVLRNFTLCNIGKKKVVETGGIEVLLAALHNHSSSSIVCEPACLTLVRITTGSKENTELLITLGGASAVAKVKKNGPDNEQVQTHVRKLAHFMAAELKTWGDEE